VKIGLTEIFMNYELPSKIASIESTGGILPTIEYQYPQSKKQLEKALKEALEQLLLLKKLPQTDGRRLL
jgi:hypothetical protein